MLNEWPGAVYIPRQKIKERKEGGKDFDIKKRKKEGEFVEEGEVEEIVSMISKVLRNKTDNNLRQKIRKEVKALCKKYPIYTKKSKV